jgi:hypothetical protein
MYSIKLALAILCAVKLSSAAYEECPQGDAVCQDYWGNTNTALVNSQYLLRYFLDFNSDICIQECQSDASPCYSQCVDNHWVYIKKDLVIPEEKDVKYLADMDVESVSEDDEEQDAVKEHLVEAEDDENENHEDESDENEAENADEDAVEGTYLQLEDENNSENNDNESDDEVEGTDLQVDDDNVDDDSENNDDGIDNEEEEEEEEEMNEYTPTDIDNELTNGNKVNLNAADINDRTIDTMNKDDEDDEDDVDDVDDDASEDDDANEDDDASEDDDTNEDDDVSEDDDTNEDDDVNEDEDKILEDDDMEEENSGENNEELGFNVQKNEDLSPDVEALQASQPNVADNLAVNPAVNTPTESVAIADNSAIMTGQSVITSKLQ